MDIQALAYPNRIGWHDSEAKVSINDLVLRLLMWGGQPKHGFVIFKIHFRLLVRLI